MEKKRVRYIDNLKWLLYFILIIYETTFIFNGCGAVGHITTKGIAFFDRVAVFIYPWLMPMIFLLSGICIRYNLEKRKFYEFLKDRVKRVLIPAITFSIFLAPIVGLIASKHSGLFNSLSLNPNFFIKYLVYLFIGTDAIKVLFTMFLGSLLIALLNKIDKKDLIYNFCSRFNLLVILLLFFPVWGASKIMNGNTVYATRTGTYLAMMLVGYYVFSNQRLSDKFEKCALLILAAIPVGIYVTWISKGLDFTLVGFTSNIYVNIFLWLTVISLYGLASIVLDYKNKKTEYLVNNYYSYYIVHYVVMLVIAHIIVSNFNLPIILNYILVFVLSLIFIPIVTQLLNLIPYANTLLFGKKKRRLAYEDRINDMNLNNDNSNDEIIDDFIGAKKIRNTDEHKFSLNIDRFKENETNIYNNKRKPSKGRRVK